MEVEKRAEHQRAGGLEPRHWSRAVLTIEPYARICHTSRCQGPAGDRRADGVEVGGEELELRAGCPKGNSTVSSANYWFLDYVKVCIQHTVVTGRENSPRGGERGLLSGTQLR